MTSPTLHRSFRLLLLVSLLGSFVGSCSSAPSSAPSSASSSSSAPSDVAEFAARESGSPANQADPSAAQTQQPQLVKTGTVTLTVDAVAPALEKIATLTRQQQGDLLRLEDRLPDSSDPRHTALLQIRVPEQNLEATLKALTQLGTVQQQEIAAEDVASQLVDHQARLRNLRKTEATLLEIMNRSGSVADVLKVAQELSNVRNLIEQVDAQVKDLENRVAYSVVTIHLQQQTVTIPAQPQLQTQIQET
ncbi:MAG: DUF4349 domain-containing protein [Elainella sp.]